MQNSSWQTDNDVENNSWRCDFLVSPHGSSHFIALHYVFPAQLIFGVCGNLCNLAVLNARGFRNPTNTFFSCVAVADILFFVSYSPSFLATIDYFENSATFREFYFGVNLKHFLTLSNWCGAASIWFTVVVSIERTFAIRNPLAAIRQRSSSTKLKQIAAIVIVVSGTFLFTFYEHFRYVSTKLKCPLPTYDLKYTKFALHFRAVHAMSAVFIPLSLLMVLNTLLVLSLRKRRAFRRKSSSGESLREAVTQENHVTAVACVIVVAFVLLNVPSGLLQLWRTMAKPKSTEMMRVLYVLANVLVLFAKDLNFLLFCVSSAKFRGQARMLLAQICSVQSNGALGASGAADIAGGRKNRTSSNQTMQSSIRIHKCSIELGEICEDNDDKIAFEQEPHVEDTAL